METPKKEKKRKHKSHKKSSRTPQTPLKDEMAAKATTPPKETMNKKKMQKTHKDKKSKRKSSSKTRAKSAQKHANGSSSAPALTTSPISASASKNKLRSIPGSPSELFKEHIKREADSGNAILKAEYDHGDQKVFFADGGKIQLLNSGHFLRQYPNGKTLQCDPSGKITPTPLSEKHRSRRTSLEGDAVPDSPDDLFKHQVKREAEAGNAIVKADYLDGDREIIFADGSKMQLLKTGHFLRNYANGATLQCNPDGKLIKVCLYTPHARTLLVC